MKLKDIQENFKYAITPSDYEIAPEFKNIFAQDHINTDQRLGIYQNNLSVSLQNILLARHEILRVLVGEDFLKALIKDFVRDNRPTHGNLNEYGFEFPNFIDQHKATKPLPYLGDVARLECSWWRSYYAPDAKSLDPRELSKLPANKHGNLKLILHPSVRLIRSAYPVFSIRDLCMRELDQSEISAQVSPNAAIDPGISQGHNRTKAPETRPEENSGALLDITQGGEFGMTLRPHLKTQTIILGEPHLKFLVYLRNGHTIGEAYGKVLAKFQNFDLRQILQEELKRGTFISYISKDL